MKKIEVTKTGDCLGYQLYLPEQFTKELPLLIYLHGAGERGECTEQLEHLERHGVPCMIREGREIPAIVLCPQCPEMFVWNNVVREVKSLIDRIVREYHVLKDRILLTGSSMGGYGTWEMGITYPNFFAAIAPVAGGGMQWRAQKLITTPVLAYHGEMDDVVEAVNSEMMVKQVQKFSGNAELHILPGLGHNEGIYDAYKNQKLIDWILVQRRTNFDPVEEVASGCF